jgi:hypothetical protein
MRSVASAERHRPRVEGHRQPNLLHRAYIRYTAAVAVPLAILVASTNHAAAAANPSFDPTGVVFACRGASYTVTGGSIVLVGEGPDPSVNPAGPFSEVPQNVTLTDGRSNTVYIMRGAVRASADSNQSPTVSDGNGLFVAHLNIVAPGRGVVDSVSMTIHFNRHGQVVLDKSTCDLPPG